MTKFYTSTILTSKVIDWQIYVIGKAISDPVTYSTVCFLSGFGSPAIHCVT